MLTGRLEPGEPFSISGLAASLGTSVIPVREALQRLAVHGLIQFRPARGSDERLSARPRTAPKFEGSSIRSNHGVIAGSQLWHAAERYVRLTYEELDSPDVEPRVVHARLRTAAAGAPASRLCEELAEHYRDNLAWMLPAVEALESPDGASGRSAG